MSSHVANAIRENHDLREETNRNEMQRYRNFKYLECALPDADSGEKETSNN